MERIQKMINRIYLKRRQLKVEGIWSELELSKLIGEAPIVESSRFMVKFTSTRRVNEQKIVDK